MIAAWLLGLGCSTGASGETTVVLQDGTVRASLPEGLPLPQGPLSTKQGQSWLTVRVEGASTDQKVLGSYARDGDELVFTPRFSITPGTRWEALWHPTDGEPQSVLLATAKSPPSPPPRLLRLEPETSTVPANLLKLTLTFSSPMAGGLTLTDHIQLVDVETGQVDEQAWYKQDLWGPDRKRLTLLLHPGRTKTGLSFNRDFGPVLEEGRRYRVEVTQGLADLSGQPLAAAHSWTFEASPADHTRPIPEDWVLTVPTPESNTLTLALDEPMDGWLLENAFVLETVSGDPVPGSWAPNPEASAVTFSATGVWSPGAYRIRQIGRVEDRAGNTPERIFDGPAETVKRTGTLQTQWLFSIEESLTPEPTGPQ